MGENGQHAPGGAAAIVTALAEAGTSVLFGVPGGGPNLDVVGAAAAAGLRFVLTHTETAAVIMAATYADLTGRPGAAVVTRGPGLASAVNGIAHAALDRLPVVVIADTVRAAKGRPDQPSAAGPGRPGPFGRQERDHRGPGPDRRGRRRGGAAGAAAPGWAGGGPDGRQRRLGPVGPGVGAAPGLSSAAGVSVAPGVMRLSWPRRWGRPGGRWSWWGPAPSSTPGWSGRR